MKKSLALILALALVLIVVSSAYASPRADSFDQADSMVKSMGGVLGTVFVVFVIARAAKRSQRS
jgi:hypothetical protein